MGISLWYGVNKKVIDVTVLPIGCSVNDRFS